jgi:hypothetical protein
MTYDTLNPIPSKDPRDLDDNAVILDQLLGSATPTVKGRLGVLLKTWWQMQQDANALVSPNVASLASLTLAANKGLYATGASALAQFDLTPLARSLMAATDATQQKAALPWAAPLDSPAFLNNPTAPTQAVGNSSTRLATTGYVQGEITNKRTWTTYTPAITPGSGAYTTISATGKYMVIFGICYFEVTITITTKGTGGYPTLSLPVAALAGTSGMPVGNVKEVGGKGGFATVLSGLTTAACADMANGDIGAANGAVLNIHGSYPVA